eukprot:8271852-Alexandrium_andersonii.AAC.1
MAAHCAGAGPAEAVVALVAGDAGPGEAGYSLHLDGAGSGNADPPSRLGTSSGGSDGAAGPGEAMAT